MTGCASSAHAPPTDAAVGPVTEARAAELRWYVGSALFSLFGVALFDQLALPLLGRCDRPRA